MRQDVDDLDAVLFAAAGGKRMTEYDLLFAVVPVGIDQASHLEFAREIVRTFNFRTKSHVLVEPQMKNTEYPKVLGLDGAQKMGKSLNNHLLLF